MHPNTKDEVVFDYLNSFGKVLTSKVIYGIYLEGPLKGFRNGNRSYKMELNPNANLGTYHVIDGHKVIVKYPGQLPTCGRCHKTSRMCKGKGIAKKCEEEQGEKVDFVQYTLDLWKAIGYSPESSQLKQISEEEQEEASANEQDGGTFTPAQKLSTLNRNYNGIHIKSFPADTDHCQIVELLIKAGLPIENISDVEIKPNGNVLVANLETDISNLLIKELHGKVHLGSKIFCNGLFTLTPEKEVPALEITTASNGNIEEPPITTLSSAVVQPKVLTSLTELIGNQDIAQYLEQNENNLSNVDLARRHSLSMRSPPRNSLGAEIINSPSNPSSLDRIKSLINEVKEMSVRLSEYESCHESTDGDIEKGEAPAEKFGFKEFTQKKRSG